MQFTEAFRALSVDEWISSPRLQLEAVHEPSMEYSGWVNLQPETSIILLANYCCLQLLTMRGCLLVIGSFLTCFSVAPGRIGALMCSAMYGMKSVFKESLGLVVSMNCVPAIHAPAITIHQKWWPKQLEVEIPSSQWGKATCPQENQFFSFGEKGRRQRGRFVLEFGVPKCILDDSFMFPLSAQRLFVMFPIYSPNSR